LTQTEENERFDIDCIRTRTVSIDSATIVGGIKYAAVVFIVIVSNDDLQR
jgi:hypothetical protein